MKKSLIIIFALYGSLIFTFANAQETALPGPTVAAEQKQVVEEAATIKKQVLTVRLGLLRGKLQEVDALMSTLRSQRLDVETVANQRLGQIGQLITEQVQLRLQLVGAIETLADLGKG